MRTYFRLLRVPNLLIIVFTQYVIRQALILPFGVPHALSHSHFFLLALSTMLIAAAGYIINDYYDLDVDRINKAQKITIGTSVSKKAALNIYTTLNVLGVLIGIYLGFRVGLYNLGFIHIIAAGLLWQYSVSFKKQPFIGNAIVALLSALVLLNVALFDLVPALSEEELELSRSIIYVIIGYASFAFMTTLIREVVKDLEDIKGDSEMGYQTLPIRWGEKKAKVLVIALSILCLSGIAVILSRLLLSDLISLGYVLLAVVVPFIYFIYRLWKAQTARGYHKAANLVKLIMLNGVLSIVVFTLSLYIQWNYA